MMDTPHNKIKVFMSPPPPVGLLIKWWQALIQTSCGPSSHNIYSTYEDRNVSWKNKILSKNILGGKV
jgi:hypothetical protein